MNFLIEIQFRNETLKTKFNLRKFQTEIQFRNGILKTNL